MKRWAELGLIKNKVINKKNNVKIGQFYAGTPHAGIWFGQNPPTSTNYALLS